MSELTLEGSQQNRSRVLSDTPGSVDMWVCFDPGAVCNSGKKKKEPGNV